MFGLLTLSMEIKVLRARIDELSDVDRLKVFEAIMKGFCKRCGTKTENRQCHCERDE